MRRGSDSSWSALSGRVSPMLAVAAGELGLGALALTAPVPSRTMRVLHLAYGGFDVELAGRSGFFSPGQVLR